MTEKLPQTKHPSTSRMRVVALGAALGAVWGAAMWGIFTIVGQETSARSLAYLIISTAMIGGGVSAIFGANQVRRRGERVTPKIRKPSRKK